MARLAGVIGLLCFTSVASAQSWPTHQGNASHDGYVPVALETSSISLRWQRVIGAGARLNPVAAADGRVFVTNFGYFSDAGLFVHDAESGDELWRVQYGSVFSVNPPAYDSGLVYLQTGNHGSDTYLRAYRAADGGVVFQARHEAQWERYLAPTIVDGVAYINGGYYGGMYAFDATNGARRWFAGLPQYDGWTPAVDANYAYSYVGEYQPALYALHRSSGELAFRIDDPNFDWNGWTMDLAPVLGGSGDVIAIHDGRLIRFDVVARGIAWQLARDFAGQPSVAHGAIFAIDSGALTAWDQESGALLWSWALPTERMVGPIVVTDTHALVAGEQRTYAVNLVTHQSEWSYAATGHLALAERALYIAGETGVLTVLEFAPPPDEDRDGIADRIDNCVALPNPDQADRDDDGVGDACNDAEDTDGDEFADALDNCPVLANASQANIDGDALGDVCDPFPDDSNNEFAQCRVDRDALALELERCLHPGDADADGVIDPLDDCPSTASAAVVDAEGCSRAQFCAAIQMDGLASAARCALADWPTSEPRLDCRIQLSRGTGWGCQAR